MPNTYHLINSQVLSTSSATVTLSAIPQTYTDLKVVISARSATSGPTDKVIMQPNNSSSVTFKNLINEGGSVVSYTQGSYGNVGGLIGFIPGATATTTTFGNIEVYLPNYSNTSYNKIYGVNGLSEDNVTAGWGWQGSTQYASTSAITSLVFTLDTASSYVANSSFELYGISNS
jgi:hypothetical protein